MVKRMVKSRAASSREKAEAVSIIVHVIQGPTLVLRVVDSHPKTYPALLICFFQAWGRAIQDMSGAHAHVVEDAASVRSSPENGPGGETRP